MPLSDQAIKQLKQREKYCTSESVQPVLIAYWAGGTVTVFCYTHVAQGVRNINDYLHFIY